MQSGQERMGDENMSEKSIKASLKRNKGKTRKVGSQTEQDKDKDFKIKKRAVEKSEVRRNPRRQVDVKNYEEIEEPPDDRYVYCDFCDEVFVDDCAKCGQLFYLRDVEVPMGTENRARCTVPKNTLAILPSPIHGLGVFAKVALKKGTKMGPYEGKITRVESTAGYSWKLRDGRLVDAADDKFSNWMRYINCARHVGEQNVVAFQYKGNLYYRTCSDIKVGQELLVYYGHSFARNLGIDVRNYFKPKEEEINENPKCCPHCNYAYKDKDRLMYHIGLCKWNPKNIQKVPDKVFFCRFCPAGITNEELYKKHEIFCQKKKDKVVPEKTQRKVKKDRREFSKKYNCDKCNYSTFRRCHLERHERTHDDFFTFTCKICRKGFNTFRNLRVHMLKHLDVAEKTTVLKTEKIHDEKAVKNLLHVDFPGFELQITKYECVECKYVTDQIGHITSHLNTHLKEKVFYCFSCGFSSKEWEDVGQHVENNHDGKCRNCQIRDYCEIHIIQKYENKGGHTCGICGNVFNTRSSLKTHLISVHLEQRNYKCHVCDYSASQKGHLSQHVSAVHLKEKNHKCHVCDYSASEKKTLTKHVSAVHLKEKNHKCHICDYSASQKRDLSRHVSAVHLKEKNHKCYLCDYSASRKADLKTHINAKHTKSEKYECNLCDYSSLYKCYLIKHKKKNHVYKVQ